MRQFAAVLLAFLLTLGTPPSANAAWNQVYFQDFNAPLALGQWPGPYTDLTAYVGCCEAHNGVTWYDPAQTLSAHDGVLDIWVLKAWRAGAMRPIGTAIKSTIPGGILHGRITLRMGVFPEGSDSMRLWWESSLLFPKSNIWNEGEVNWPEAQMDVNNQTAVAFNHKLGQPRINCDQFYRKNMWTVYGWHTYIIDWKPDSFAFYYDWQLLGVSTCALPSTPMNYILQVGTLGNTPSADSHGRVLIDSIAIDAYVP